MASARNCATMSLASTGSAGVSSIAPHRNLSRNARLDDTHIKSKLSAKFGMSHSRSTAVTTKASKGESSDDAAILREENAALRAQVRERLDKLTDTQRSAFVKQHGALVEAGNTVGEVIPSLVKPSAPVVKAPVAETAPVVPHEPVAAAAIPTAAAVPAPPSSSDNKVVLKDDGVSAVLEVERDNTLVFKFGPADGTEASSSVTNKVAAKSLAINSLYLMPATSSRSAVAGALSGGKGGGKGKDSAIVFTFDEASESKKTLDSSEPGLKPSTAASVPASIPATTAAAAPVPAAPAASLPKAGTSSSGSESESDGGTKTKGRRSSGGSSTTRKASPSTEASKAPKSSPKADPLAAARAAATKEAQSHDPAKVLADREHWLYATVPAVPVAGAECVLYYNKAQSDSLRHRPRVQLHAKYNNWELEPQGDAGDRVDMAPAEGAPKGEGSDFWRATVQIPTDAYEINFIFSDGEGVYDNNNTENYSMPSEGPMTRELWVDTAPERAEAAFLARKETERVANAAAAKEREAAALAADAERAQQMVSELKDSYGAWRDGAVTENGSLWSTVPATVVAGKSAVLRYNRTAGPLSGIPVPDGEHLVLKVGYNSWKEPKGIVMKKAAAVKGANASDEWWEASIDVSPNAAVLNFVVQYYDHYDNNGGADHKVAVSLPAGVASVEKWADALLPSLKIAVTTARKEAEAAAEASERARVEARLAVKAKTEEVRRRQMRHLLYTEPAIPVAGQQVKICYNPNNTVLHGAERVFLSGGYNRWRHPKGYGPLEMTSPGTGEHFSVTVTVPKDAYSLDFVFSDAQEGGRFDNHGGLDYNLPVEGSVVSEPPLYVVHVAVEMAPICKVGGLGDVVTALGRAVQEAGHQVEIVLPRYDFFLQSPLLGGTQYETEFEWAGTRIFVSSCIVEGLRCWFIEPGNGTFATSTVYQGASDAARFAFFSRAALEFLLRTGRQPDILHCHDWSTADVAKAYWTEYHQYGLWKPNVVFTIHNLNYGAAQIGEASYFSQRFTTVSPSYGWEIGGHPAIAANNSKLMGIRNGIDVDIWNPETDQFLPVSYTADNAEDGKAAARDELRRRVGLSGWGDKPLVGVVTRLTKQKGTHLIAHSCFRTLERGGQFILLGSAPDPKVQAEFDALKNSHGGENAAFCFAFDEPLSHLIYAACDIILVPSMFEPCGLTQMIAMRYGSVPVVRATGGLKDTVFDVDTDKERAAWEMEGSTNWVADEVDATNGFAFEGTDPGALDYALNRALDAWYNDRAWFRSLQQRVMRQDWSWNKPAIDYIQLYYAALKK